MGLVGLHKTEVQVVKMLVEVEQKQELGGYTLEQEERKNVLLGLHAVGVQMVRIQEH